MSARVVAILTLLMAAACAPPLHLTPSDADKVLSRQLLDAPDPASPGPYDVHYLVYGSGTDRHRAAYRDSVAFRTLSVDASELVDLGDDADERNEYWGFMPEAFPLNARVWYPDGPGPFPLVLIVHGNHDMRDFSDPGYAYLGRLLASRGFILASIDENFLNGRIRQENDARAWMLLKHIEAWHRFTSDPVNPLHGLVDLDRIALIGHSRGGEAVAHAAAFNRLPRYPDDATIAFDFDFGIRAIVAIAPVDGQYRPADRLMPVRDVSYLVFHGSHDGDVSSFAGLRQYQRVHFSDDAAAAATAATADVPRFKAAVYVYRANHGQWNTVWGANDNGPRSSRILDLRALLEPEEQRRFAEVYVSAFLEATLHDDARYLPLFRDHRVAGGWLPKTMYITRFESARFRPVATYERGVDVTRGSLDGVTLEGHGLSTWKEGLIQLRSANTPAEGTSQYNNAVWLGWGEREGEQEGEQEQEGEGLLGSAIDSASARPPAYALSLPDSLAGAWDFGGGTSLQFLLAPTGEGEGTDDAEDDAAGSAREQFDLSIRVVDAAGESASVGLRRYGVPREPLEIRILRRRDIEKREFGALHELVLQTYTIPLADFTDENAALDLSRLRTVEFVFDRTAAGEMILDRVGFVRLDPTFTRAVVRR